MFERDNLAIEEEGLKKHMNINCFAPILLSQTFASLNSEKRLIINMLDNFAKNPSKNFTSYMLSKRALLYAQNSLILRLEQTCRINSISLGLTLEPEAQKAKDLFKKVKEANPHMLTKLTDILYAIDRIIKHEHPNGEDIRI